MFLCNSFYLFLQEGEKDMPRMSKKKKLEYSFFINDKGRISYNDLCKRCCKDCKQSFRTTIIECKHYVSKRSVSRSAKGDVS